MTTALAIKEIAFKDVTRSYNGRIGCACGCKGLYSEAGTASTRLRLNVINSALSVGRTVHITDCGDTICYEFEHNTGRVTKVYVMKS